jgi:3-oxoacyl-[acyl-carrier protein] reductase
MHGDLALAEVGAEVVRQAAESLGRLDILVNNTGAIRARQPFGELDLGLCRSSLDLNVRSVLAVSQAAISHLERQGGGSIVNIGSIAGGNGGGPGSAHYACAKAKLHVNGGQYMP